MTRLLAFLSGCLVLLALSQAPSFAADAKDAQKTWEDLRNEANSAYKSGNYEDSAGLLKQAVELLRKDSAAVDRLLVVHGQLAYVYAWNLKKYDSAIKEYQSMMEERRAVPILKDMIPLELQYIGEIQELKGDYEKARNSYQALVAALSADKSNDTDIVAMNDVLKAFLKYRIDGIGLKTHTGGDFKPALEEINLATWSYHMLVVPFLGALYAQSLPELQSFGPSDEPSFMNFLKTAPQNIAYEYLNCGAIWQMSSDGLSEQSEKAMDAYASRFPDGLFTLNLRYHFYRLYLKSGQTEKAEAMMEAIEGIARSRHIKILVGPDTRYSSPEKTWAIYKEALLSGNVEAALDCFTPQERHRYEQVFSALGNDKLKDMAANMREIQKITGDEEMAKYRIRKEEQGQEVTYYIYFFNLGGEWKMGVF